PTLPFTARIGGLHLPILISQDLLFLIAGWLVWSPTARVQRGPSEAARCASTGDQRATFPLPPLP
ncbi:MAG: hypothetical protein ACREJN_04690, partial [Nitrospiraceae bacterium]